MYRIRMMNVGSAVEYSASDTLSNESQSAYVPDKEPPLAATISSMFHNTLGSDDGEMQQIDYNDIGCWPATNKQIVSSIVVKGPTRIMDCDFPETKGRRFLTAYYKRKLPNSKTVDRRWLVYSMHLDRAFCFCCKLFSNSTSKFSHDSYCDWKNITAILAEHETSCNHIEAHKIWVDTENRLNQKQTIDSEFQRCILAEEMHWRGVLERLLAIVQFLAQNNMAFRGTEERLNAPNNGNFLGLVQLVAKFDPVLHEHVRQISNDEIHDHYLGKQVPTANQQPCFKRNPCECY